MTSLLAAAETHRGYARSINEDQALTSGDLAAVADGMGGHLGGEVAARMAIEELLSGFSGDRTSAGFVTAVRRANRAIWRRSRVERNLRGMGTTLTAVALVEDAGAAGGTRLFLVHVGDSRAYRLGGADRGLERLTEDHTLVEEMVRNGELTPDEAAVHPHRHVITRVLGVEPDVEPDVFELPVDAGTRLLLCSDGLSNEVPESEIALVMASAPTPSEAAHELVGRALSHGGTDNVTVVVVDLTAGEGAADLSVELVPALPVTPDTGPEEAADITRAVPVTALYTTAETAVTVAEEDETVAPPSSAGGDPPEDGNHLGRSMVVRESRPPAGARADGGVQRSGRRRLDGASGTGDLSRADPLEDAPPDRGRPVVLVPGRGFRKGARDRIVTARVVVFVLLLAGVLGGAAAVVIWFNQASYFVGLSGDHVAIYQGRPGGMLWFKPQLMETSTLRRSDLLPGTVAALHTGVSESSLAAARQLVDRLQHERQFVGFPGQGSGSTSSTAAPGKRGTGSGATGAGGTGTGATGTAPAGNGTAKAGAVTTTGAAP